MKTTISTRKPVDEITAEDLRCFPIWEYALDEEGDPDQDETWIKPASADAVPSGAYSQIVAASFTVDSSTSLTGFMIVTTAEQPVALSPGAIVTDGGYRFIPSSPMSGYEERREALARNLGVTFPLAYRLCVAIAGEQAPRHGIIE